MFKYDIAKDMWVSIDELQPYVKGAQEGLFLMINSFLYLVKIHLGYNQKLSKKYTDTTLF